MIEHGSGPGGLYGLLPSVDELLRSPELVLLTSRYSRGAIRQASREMLAGVRRAIAEGHHSEETLRRLVATLPEAVSDWICCTMRATLVPVLNATGVILHTNLGRAPLSHSAVKAIAAVAGGYSNLEFDLETGSRGQRDAHAEELLLRVMSIVTGRQIERGWNGWGAAVVNNCAAATFLALNSLAEGGEVLVSRGELVEIGGGFRIPEILRKAGVRLREVGTTNKTRLDDYAQCINESTRMILRVHQSNFKIEGFTEKPELSQLIELGRSSGVPVFEDQGTGLMIPLDSLGVREESSLLDSFRKAPDLIAASGDKLLGGPQCGLLLGRAELVERIRANPLFRALRVDKLTYAALQATLLSYSAGTEEEVPTIRMLRTPVQAIEGRCQGIVDTLDRGGAASRLKVSVVPAESVIGGGSTAGATLRSFALCIQHEEVSASELLCELRRNTPPVIGRVQNDAVLLDLRTVGPEQDETLTRILERLG